MGEAGGGARRRGRPLLLGHRGARNYAPENTPAAFDLALQHGCDGFEFDARLTADRQAVVCHDAGFEGREVATSSYAELACLGALPRLDEVVSRFAGVFLDIEVKVSGMEDEVLAAVTAHPPQRYFLSSFLPQVVRTVSSRADVPLGYICDEAKKLEEWRRLPIGYLAPHWSLVERDLVEEAHAAGVQVFVWTVNDARAMRKFADMSVDGLISDDTRLLARTFTD